MATSQDMSVAEMLRHFRRAAGLTQEELASRAQMSARAISNIERGVNTPYAKTLLLLADALHLSTKDRLLLESAVQRVHTATGFVVANATTTTLPLPITRMIGREQEVDALLQLILRDRHRLVTLTGPAGIGKTRLALGLASQLKPHFPDGIWFIPLASLQDWHLIPTSIAQSLAIQEEHQQSLWDCIATYLAHKTSLLILDNLEHLLEGGAFVADLLSSCPKLVIVVTSRAALRVRGEQRFPVPPLSFSESADGERGAAEELFIERAREVQPLLPLTPTNMASIAAICRRLEGIPLAIELAAMRVATFTPPDLLRRLDHRLPLLTMGARDLPERQQTMRDAIAWSYDLLAPTEQAAFRRLAIFTGGWTLSAAQAIWGDEVNADNLLMILATLMDANLIQRWSEGVEEPRFAMLEILREFGLEQLTQHKELECAQCRHAKYMFALAQTTSPALRGSEQEYWLGRLDQEHDNLRAALEWAKQHDARLGLGIAAAVWWFWCVRRYLSEGRFWVELFLTQARSYDDVTILQAQANLGAGVLAQTQGHYEQAAHFVEISATLFQEAGDSAGMCSAWSTLGNIMRQWDRFGEAEAYHRQALVMSRSLDDDKAQMATVLNNLAALLGSQGRYHEGEALLQESLAIKSAQGDHYGITASLVNLSNVAYEEGGYDRATAYAEEALRHGNQTGSRSLVGKIFVCLGKAACGQGDFQKALEALEQSRQIFEETQDATNIANAFLYLGEVACAQHEWSQAERYFSTGMELSFNEGINVEFARCLAGRARALLEQGMAEQATYDVAKATAILAERKVAPQASVNVRLKETKRAIEQALGEETFQAAWEHGEALHLEDLPRQ